ncbi:hypothetical protein A9Q99_22145 [Gammaproteobacteria bacterium 45_16_T64]|nr:hypothetical protein A9Q99_22145 [Gammaproteobacteria bacterium 45_16_T64]
MVLKNRVVALLVLCGGLSVLSGCEYIDDIPVGARYIAKNICSGIFVSGYDETLLVDDYVTSIVPPLKPIWNISIDRDEGVVTVSDKIFNKTYEAVSVYREGLGCVNQRNESIETLRGQGDIQLLTYELPTGVSWPYGDGGVDDSLQPEASLRALSRVIDEEFINPVGTVKHTTGVVVVKGGRLIAEQYAGGISENSPVKGFSMSKSVVNALAGILYDQGELDLDASLEIDEWQGTESEGITFRHLAQMSSGIRYLERAIGDDNDQGRLLYGELMPFDFMLTKPQAEVPGEVYNYSSGDSLLAAHSLQRKVGDAESMYRFYQQALFHNIDITTALIEHSGDGFAIAPESLMLSLRDWARLGLLYQNNGRWGDKQVLSEQWMDYSLSEGATNPSYGAFLWLNTGQWFFNDLPEDTIAFVGALERYVVIIPSLELIVVRVGFSHDRDEVDINAFVKDILVALEGDGA